MAKKVAILFSGGLDSTYLVWKNLKDGNSVIPIYVEIRNNKVKSILEKNRIELLWKEFNKEFNVNGRYDKLDHNQYSVALDVFANEDSLYFKQIPIWMFTVVFLQSLNVDEIQIGYVMNDDAISYLDDIQNIYKSYQAISEPMKPLIFPLAKEKKWRMAKELPKKYLDLIFSCENATIIGDEKAELIEYEACCECAPCKVVVSNHYYETGNFPKSYKRNLIYYHVRALRHMDYKVVDGDGKEYDHWGDVELCKTISNEPVQLEIPFQEDTICRPTIEYYEADGNDSNAVCGN